MTLAFYLAGLDHGHGGDVAGLFGPVGVVGAPAAPPVVRSADRRSPRTTAAIGLASMLLAYGVRYGLAGRFGSRWPG